ncbi:MAG: GNAT family N-acetyltransferase, partial [Candidatus Rokubacteria bacterium]|nr:GNAT family N-acetyltransferase [Candidatus Rokubacteria bacterium]
MSIVVRDATAADAAAICRIYNQGIQDRIATLETEERTPEERRAWLEGRSPRHPVIVAEAGGEVVGWGSLNVFNPRRAYDHVADFSLYVERDWRGRGVGGRLLDALIARA